MSSTKIGEFYASGSGYQGTIRTRKLKDLGHVVIVAHDKNGDHEPDFLVKADGDEIGKAWKHTAKESEREYLNVVLDDPHMEQQIRSRLVHSGDRFILLWERSE